MLIYMGFLNLHSRYASYVNKFGEMQHSLAEDLLQSLTSVTVVTTAAYF